MAGSGEHGEARTRDARLRPYVAAWVIAAVAIVVLTVVASPGVVDRRPDVGLAVALGVAATILGFIHVEVPLRGTLEGTTLTELAFVPIMVLLPPATAVVTAVAAALIAEPVITRWQPRKFLFNVAWLAVGVATGSWLYHLAAPTPFSSRPSALLLALLAGAALVAINLVALSGVISITAGSRWTRTIASQLPASFVLSFGTAAVGVLVAALVVHAPAALPILVVLVLLQATGARARSESHRHIARERSRFERTVDGSSDGIVLVGPDGRIEVWNARMVELTGVPEAEAVGRTLADVDAEQLLAPGQTGGTSRTTLAEGVVDVGVASVDVPGSSPGERVVTVRDVSQEAELARIREDLVMRVSHEIRTPLTTLSGFLETLQARWDTLDEPQRLALLEAARRGGRRLSHLVTNLMVWARIEAVSKAAPEGAAVRATVLEVVEELPVAARVEVTVDADLRVAMSAQDLDLVVANLIENAVLYGRPPVQVTAVPVGDDKVELAVGDSGEGLPQERVAALYEPFEQQSEGLTRTARGLGMGLAVVRALTTEAGGSVRYETAPGGGACFVVTLPAAAERPA